MRYLTSSSALRLCVWLFDDCNMYSFCFYQTFLFALRTIKRIIYQNCIFSNFGTSFIFADRAKYPFYLYHYFPLSLLCRCTLLVIMQCYLSFKIQFFVYIYNNLLISNSSCFILFYMQVTIYILEQAAVTLCHFYNKRYIEAFITNISIYLSIHKPHQPAAYEKSKPVALHLVRIISTMKALEYLR